MHHHNKRNANSLIFDTGGIQKAHFGVHLGDVLDSILELFGVFIILDAFEGSREAPEGYVTIFDDFCLSRWGFFLIPRPQKGPLEGQNGGLGR